MKSRMRHILIIMAFSVGVFLPSITGGFLWDDEFLIVHNPRIKSLKNIPAAFTSEFFQGSFETEQITFYRPAVTVFNTVQYAIFGLRPFWWRLTNLLLHALNAALVYLLLTRLLRLRENAVFFAVLLYAIHPVLSEAVCFVSGRTDLLAMLCILLSLLFYFQGRRKNPARRFLSIAFFTIGLFTKEIVLLLPAAIAAMDYITSEQSTPREWVKERSRHLLQALLPFFIIGAVYLIVRFFFVKGITIPPYPSGDAITTWLIMPSVFMAYILSIIFPIGLSCDNTNSFSIITSPFDPWFLICFGITVVIIAIMVWLFFRKSNYFIGFFWLLLFLAPVMNIFPLGIWMAFRFMYIPLAGVAMIFAVVDVEKILWKKLGCAFWGFFLVDFIILSLYWSYVWRDELTLWSNAVYQNRNNPQARVIYAQALFSRGMITEAENELATADTSKSLSLAIAKEQTLVKIYIAQKQYDNAAAALSQAAALLPHSAVNAMLEGRLHLSQGRMDEAERAFRKALEIKPELLGAAVGLMETLAGRGAPAAELLHAAEQAIAINPDFAPSYVYKGMALRKIGKDDEAMSAFKNAIRLSPEAPESYLFLADMYETRAAKDAGALKNAIAIYQILLKRHHDNIDALNNLAIIYAQKGEKEKARELWNRLLAIRPDDPEAKSNLQRLDGGIK